MSLDATSRRTTGDGSSAAASAMAMCSGVRVRGTQPSRTAHPRTCSLLSAATSFAHSPGSTIPTPFASHSPRSRTAASADFSSPSTPAFTSADALPRSCNSRRACRTSHSLPLVCSVTSSASVFFAKSNPATGFASVWLTLKRRPLVRSQMSCWLVWHTCLSDQSQKYTLPSGPAWMLTIRQCLSWLSRKSGRRLPS